LEVPTLLTSALLLFKVKKISLQVVQPKFVPFENKADELPLLEQKANRWKRKKNIHFEELLNAT